MVILVKPLEGSGTELLTSPSRQDAHKANVLSTRLYGEVLITWRKDGIYRFIKKTIYISIQLANFSTCIQPLWQSLNQTEHKKDLG